MFGSIRICTCTIPEVPPIDSHFRIYVSVSGKHWSKQVAAMIDSGASGIFISNRFVTENHVLTIPMKHPIVLYNVDGSRNLAGSITHYAKLRIQVGTSDRYIEALATNISSEDLILEIPWLREENPDIDWKGGSVTFKGDPV